MFELGQKFSFVHHRIHRSLRNDPCFVHFFHRIELLCFLQLDLPNLTKAPFPNDVVELEAVLVNR